MYGKASLYIYVSSLFFQNQELRTIILDIEEIHQAYYVQVID